MPDLPDRLRQLEAAFDPERCLIRRGDCWIVAQQSLEYAIMLLDRDATGDRERAASVVATVLDTQVTEPAWDRGRFPMLIPETWRDLNAILFMAPQLVDLDSRCRDRLQPALASRLHDAIVAGVEAVDRRWADEIFDPHRDFDAYSNIFVLYVQALLLLGRHLNDERLRRDGVGQWRRWFNHVSTYGIDEFCSPTYNQVVYEGLLGILQATSDADVRHEARLVLDHLAALQHAVSHPLLGVETVGSSRNYRLFAQPGEGVFRFLDHEPIAGYRPPEAVVTEFRARRYPHRVTGRAGRVPFRFQSWQLPDAAMGSMTGGHYFPQQVHLLAAAGTSPRERAVAILDATPANAANGYVRQRDGRALCLFARTVTSYQLNQCRKADMSQLPLPVLPPCLGFTDAWSVEQPATGRLVATACGYRLHVQARAWIDNALAPIHLESETIPIRDGCALRGWRAPDISAFVVFLVELTREDETPPPSTLAMHQDETSIDLSESAGLALRVVRRPNGECVEPIDGDWRLLPLLDCPTLPLESGDLIAAAIRRP